jgi:hypothetical protein
MEQVQKSTSKHWLIFLVWLVIMIVMLVLPTYRPFFWLALPGVVTHFCYAMNLIE